MKDLAPDITRKRLLIEATYSRDVNTSEQVKEYLLDLAEKL
jgi:hypothetical protein